MFKKTSRFKPLYKKFVRLRQNVQNRKKLYNFNRKKWQNLLKFLLKLKRRRRKIRIYDHNIYYKPRFTFYFKNRFRFKLYTKNRLNLFYGSLSKRYLKLIVKNALKNVINVNLYFIEILERRIDTILYRSHFVPSIRNARQLISHGQIFVNNQQVKNNSYIVKKGDLIDINLKSHNLIKDNIYGSNKWPIPPNYLQINYKTFQILLISNVKHSKVIFHFPFWLNINSLIKCYNI